MCLPTLKKLITRGGPGCPSFARATPEVMSCNRGGKEEDNPHTSNPRFLSEPALDGDCKAGSLGSSRTDHHERFAKAPIERKVAPGTRTFSRARWGGGDHLVGGERSIVLDKGLKGLMRKPGVPRASG